MSEPKILDLDKLIPDQRIVRLAGVDIDVSKIPSRVTMELSEKADVFKKANEKSFPALIEMIIKIMKPSKPDVTDDWLIDNTSMDQLLALIEFVLEPLQDKIEETQAKNQQAPKVQPTIQPMANVMANPMVK